MNNIHSSRIINVFSDVIVSFVLICNNSIYTAISVHNPSLSYFVALLHFMASKRRSYHVYTHTTKPKVIQPSFLINKPNTRQKDNQRAAFATHPFVPTRTFRKITTNRSACTRRTIKR